MFYTLFELSIISLIDVYRDTAIRGKLIFPSAIMRILHHFSVSYPKSSHFSVMGAIDVATVRRSAAQLRQRQPQTKMATPPASTTPSTSTSSSSTVGVILEAIMAQIVRMDACLDTLSDELCQVNTRVSHIAQRQAIMGGFIVASFTSPLASEDENDDGNGSEDTDDDDGASLPSDDEMST